MKNLFDKALKKIKRPEHETSEVIVDAIENTYIDDDLSTAGNTTTFGSGAKTFSPTNYNELKEPVDWLKKYKKVIISFKQMDEANYKRSVNFLSGITYGLDGQIERIEPKVFELTIR